MDNEFDWLDFERHFLADLLQMLQERLTTLQSYVDPNHPEEANVFDPMEHLAGVGAVAAQRYIASVCNWFHVNKDDAFQLGPTKNGEPVASIIHAAANYWKHIEDGDGGVRRSTLRVLEKIGIDESSKGYCVTNTLYRCGYQHFSGLMEDLIQWRDAVYQRATEQ